MGHHGRLWYPLAPVSAGQDRSDKKARERERARWGDLGPAFRKTEGASFFLDPVVLSRRRLADAVWSQIRRTGETQGLECEGGRVLADAGCGAGERSHGRL